MCVAIVQMYQNNVILYKSVTFCQNTKVEITTQFGYTDKFIFS